MTPAEQIKEKIQTLREALLASHPMLPNLLREIHKTLKDDPENVTLLDEDDIRTVVAGLKHQTKIEIASAVAKSKTKSLKSMTLADL